MELYWIRKGLVVLLPWIAAAAEVDFTPSVQSSRTSASIVTAPKVKSVRPNSGWTPLTGPRSIHRKTCPPVVLLTVLLAISSGSSGTEPTPGDAEPEAVVDHGLTPYKDSFPHHL